MQTLTVHGARQVLLNGDAVLLDQRVLLAGHAAAKPQHEAVEQQQRKQLAEQPHQQLRPILAEVDQRQTIPLLALLLQGGCVCEALCGEVQPAAHGQRLQHPAQLALK